MLTWTKRILYVFTALLLSAYLVLQFLVPVFISSRYFSGKLNAFLTETIHRDIKFNPNLKFSWDLIPKLTVGDLELSQPAKFSQEPPLLRLRSAYAVLDPWMLLKGKLRFNHINFDEAEINLLKDEHGKASWDFSKEETNQKNVETKKDIYLPEIDLIDFRKVNLSFSNKTSEKKYQAYISDLSLKGFGTKSLSIDSAFRIKGIDWKVESSLPGLEDIIFRRASPFHLKLSSGDLKLKIDGNYDPESSGSILKLKSDISGNNTSIASVLNSFNETLPFNPGEFNFSFALDLKEDELRISGFDGQIQESLVKSDFTYSLKTHEVNGKIYSENFDLDKYIPGKKDEKEKEKEKGGYIFNEKPIALSLPFFSSVNVSLDLNDFRTSENILIKKVKAKVNLSNSEFSVKELHSEMFGGSLSGELVHSQQGTSVLAKAFELDFSAVSPSNGVEGGKFSLNVDVRAKGDSLRQMAESTSGSIDLKLVNVALNGGGLFYSTSNLFDILNPLSKGKKSAHIKCIYSKFKLSEGIADSLGSAAKVEDVYILGDGRIDLKKETVAMGFVPRSSSLGAATLIPPLKLHGPLTHPSIIPNPLRLAAEELDSLQGLLTGALSFAGHIGRGISESVGLVNKSKTPTYSPETECEELIKENSDNITTLVGDFVFGR